MGEVHAINGTELIGPDGYNRKVVAGLERLLKKARDGEVVGYSVVLSYKDGSASISCQGAAATYSSVGAATCLVHRLTSTLE